MRLPPAQSPRSATPLGAAPPLWCRSGWTFINPPYLDSSRSALPAMSESDTFTAHALFSSSDSAVVLSLTTASLSFEQSNPIRSSSSPYILA